MNLETADRSVSVRLTTTLKSLISEHFAVMNSRASGEGVYVHNPTPDDPFLFNFFELALVKQKDEELYTILAGALNDPVEGSDRYTKKDLLFALPEDIRIEDSKGDLQTGRHWWVKKHSSAATFISLDQPKVDIARRASKKR